MSDNTILPTGSGGDTIRTIDRTTSKTQVVQLDAGGEAGPEALVTQTNALPTRARDEFGNQVNTSEQTDWQTALLDEMRAIRIGIQHLLWYMNPASGEPTQPLLPVPGLSISRKMGGEEVDIYQASRSIRDDFNDEVIQ
jgi:hypothetical protein